jgi:hypothetical protein
MVDNMMNMIGQIYGQNQQLPLQYGGLYQNAYAPYFNYAGQQAGNMAGLGQQNIGTTGQIGQQNIGTTGQIGQGAMSLYGNLANTQAGMYQSELPFQMQSQMFNSLAPVLGGLLSQGGFGGLPSISPVQMNFDRPDVMSGFPGTVNQAYGSVNNAANQAYSKAGNAYGQAVNNTQSYDDRVGGMMADMMDKMPTAPYMQKPQRAPAPSTRSPAYQPMGSISR